MAPEPAAKPLPDPRLRRSDPRGPWSVGGASVCRDRSRRLACPPHALGEALEVRAERPDFAIALLEAANALYFEQPYMFGPPSALGKPPSELLGETLIENGRYEEARQAFERALTRAPGRRASLAGLERLER